MSFAREVPARLCAGLSLWLALAPSSVRAEAPEHVSLVWMSVTNWYIEVGETRIVMDGYISRIPASAFSGPTFAFAEPTVPDEEAIGRVIRALGSPAVDYVLTGHSHFDHAFDSATWARLTGARLIGSRSTCLQAEAQQIPAARCTAVEGGEVINLGEGVTVRVVRWNHSGDVTTDPGRQLHAPLELARAPVREAGGGLRPGVLQDFPNGGGARAYLFSAETRTGPVHWFYSNTGAAETFRQPAQIEADYFAKRGLPLDGLVFAPPGASARERLTAALSASGLEGVDLWLGAADRAIAAAVDPVLHAKAHVPHHWDGLFTPFFAGVPHPYAELPGAAELRAFWEARGARLLPPEQTMEAYQLSPKGVRRAPNREAQRALGFE